MAKATELEFQKAIDSIRTDCRQQLETTGLLSSRVSSRGGVDNSPYTATSVHWIRTRTSIRTSYSLGVP